MNLRFDIAILSALCLGMPLSAQAFQVRHSRTGSIIRWDRAEFPIHYYIDSNPAMPEGAVGAVTQAFQSWENTGPARLSFVYKGRIKNPSVAYDGKNCIIWVEERWRHGFQTIAHATTWYSLENGSIADCDIEINAKDYDWSIAPLEEMLDIQNVITHEVGHLLGLDDVFNTLDETMFGFILKEEIKKRSLYIDDIRGSIFLYPLSATFEEIEASSVDPDKQSLSPLLSPRSTPEGTNITLISSCDWNRDGISGEIAAVSYDAESGFSFHVYSLPDADKGEKDISTLAADDWLIASGHNTRGMAVVDANGDGFRDEIAVLKDNEKGESVISLYKFSSAMDAPSFLYSTSLGESDSTTHITGTNGNEICMLRKIKGRDYNLSLYKLDISQETLSRKEDYGQLPIDPDEVVLSIFPMEEEPGKAAALGVLVIDRKGRARIDFMEPTANGEVANLISVKLPDSSPVLATSIDCDGDGLIDEIVLITE